MQVELKPHKITLDEDLDNAAKHVKDDMKAKAEELLDFKLIEEYSIGGDLETALQNGEGKISSSGLISVKSSKSKHETPSKAGSSKSEKKRNKDDRGSKSNKRRKS
ncbi:RNA cytidine acetyltransferase 1-like [Silene latifolia]|uniref:RNA cytidine acetyltransferase 1-like n=1 Tax=Silene latifolia TaxID=37657 RepID=UPI003D76FEDA